MAAPMLSSSTVLLFMILAGTNGGLYWDNYHLGESYVGQETHFHCGRPGQMCQNGGECYSGYYRFAGSCYCPGYNYYGYDCGINVTHFPFVEVVYDGCPCQNIHFCYTGDDGETLQCACPPDYFGHDCSKNRVKVECEAQSMMVAFNPIEPFMGIAYVGSEPYNDSCRLHMYDEGGEYTYSNYIHHDEGCGLIESEGEYEGQPVESYTLQLTIQYDPVIQSGLDLLINVTCHQQDNGTWVTNGSFGVSRGDLGQGKDIQNVYFPVTMKITTGYPTYREAGNVYLGQRLHLKFALTDNDVYRRLVVDSCTFSNSLGDHSLKAIEDRCPTERSSAMGMYGPHDYDGYGVQFYFRAIRFGDDPVLKVSCRIRLCESFDSPGCSYVDCGDRSWDRRRKREATESQDEGIVTKSLTILDPYDENGQAFKVTTTENCMSEPVIKSVGISLVTALVVMVFVCVGLALCLCRMTFARREIALKLRYSQNGPSQGFNNHALENGAEEDFKSKVL